jgi:hypothetical protein
MGKAGWIGVDLDGTLAYYNGWKNTYEIGDPIPLMLARVKEWLREGSDVRIFTARVDGVPQPHLHDNKDAVSYFQNTDHVRQVIEAWCLEHIGQILPITNKKDFHMIELWDDRCVQVIPNTGITLADKLENATAKLSYLTGIADTSL